jgi:hypothetical protein
MHGVRLRFPIGRRLLSVQASLPSVPPRLFPRFFFPRGSTGIILRSNGFDARVASPRYKLLRLSCESLGPSADAPACEDFELTALLESEDGRTIERRRMVLAYPRIMSDPEQFPALLAAELRAMMISG